MESYYCGWYENEINELNKEGIWERVYHMSYLYLSMFCFIISMVVGLAVSAATGGLQESYRKSHSKEMFNTFFPTSYYWCVFFSLPELTRFLVTKKINQTTKRKTLNLFRLRNHSRIMTLFNNLANIQKIG